MQDLSEGVFISMANFTLACRDSYLEYLHAGVKQDTLTTLHSAPVHLQSLFPDQLLIKAEEEVSRSEERHSSSQSQTKPSRFHQYASNDKSSHQLDRKSTIPTWKQIRESQKGRKGRGKPCTFSQKLAKDSKQRKWQLLCKVYYRTEGLFLCVWKNSLKSFTSDGQKQRLDQQERDCKFTCKLLCCKCSFCYLVATKERRNSQLLSQWHRNKICERCFLCGSLEFCKSCHKCPNCCHRSTCRGQTATVLRKMGSLGGESQGSNSTQRGLHPPLLVQTQLNQITNCHKQLCKPSQKPPPFGGSVSAGEQKFSRTKNHWGFTTDYFWYPNPTIGGDLSWTWAPWTPS